MIKTLLTVAGYDPSGGAGVLQDIKVFGHFGFHGAAVLTALTIQNTRGVKRIVPLREREILEQYKALREDVRLAGVKVGMLGTGRTFTPLAEILEDLRRVPRVIDPVLRAGTGTWLMEKKAISSFLDYIKGRATLLTPNLSEAALLTGKRITRSEQMEEAARRIFDAAGAPCLVKGGRGKRKTVDVLFDGKAIFRFEGRMIGKEVHGTGCFLASGLLGHLATGKNLVEACALAIEMTRNALRRARRVGKGQAVVLFPL